MCIRDRSTGLYGFSLTSRQTKSTPTAQPSGGPHGFFIWDILGIVFGAKAPQRSQRAYSRIISAVGFGGDGKRVIEHAEKLRGELMGAPGLGAVETAQVRVRQPGAHLCHDICLLYTSPSPRDGL